MRRCALQISRKLENPASRQGHRTTEGVRLTEKKTAELLKQSEPSPLRAMCLTGGFQSNSVCQVVPGSRIEEWKRSML